MKILPQVQLALQKILSEYRAEIHGREGGVLCIATAQGLGIHWIVVGSLTSKEAYEKYAYFAGEKAARLASFTSHISSFQSRDVENKKYAGAIRAGNYILSFSGLPELADEAVVAYAAYLADLINQVRFGLIGHTSTNPYLPYIDFG